MRNHKIYILLMLGLAVSVSPTYAQIVYDQPTAGGGQMIYSHWSIENSDKTIKLNQFVIPINGFVPIQDNLEARFSLATVSSRLEQAGTDYKLSGLGDIRLQFNQSLVSDRLLLSLGLNLPTGKKRLDLADEWPVMEYLAKDYLDLPVRRYGEGLGINFLTGVAGQIGEMQLGASVLYGYNGIYEAYEGGGDYNPGDMFSLTAGLDTPLKNWVLSGRVSFAAYGTDRLDDEKIFRAGRQLALQLGVTTENDNYDFRSNIRYVVRGRNTRYDSTEVIFDQLKIYGNELAWDCSVSFDRSEDYYVVPSFESRFIGANEYDFEKSHLIGFGVRLGRRFTEDIDANFGFKYYTGSADGGDIDLKGFQLSLNLAAAFR